MASGIYYTIALIVSAIALSVSIATFFWNAVVQRRNARRSRTLDLIISTRLNAQLVEWLRLREHHFPAGKSVDLPRFTAYLGAERDRDLSDDEALSRRQSADALRSLLNYYEFIAFGIASGELDEEMLKGTIRAIMCNLVMDCVHLIVDVREEDPRTFEHLARLYERWRDDTAEPIPLD